MRTFVRDVSGLAFMRFRRALDRCNVTEALSSASELEHVGPSLDSGRAGDTFVLVDVLRAP